MGGVLIEAKTIDSLIDEKVTYLKMDIEGTELKALLGAKETILRSKPKLAICVYHKPEDLIEIPLLLKGLVSDYRFFLRHYSNNDSETVLYAVR